MKDGSRYAGYFKGQATAVYWGEHSLYHNVSDLLHLLDSTFHFNWSWVFFSTRIVCVYFFLWTIVSNWYVTRLCLTWSYFYPKGFPLGLIWIMIAAIIRTGKTSVNIFGWTFNESWQITSNITTLWDFIKSFYGIGKLCQQRLRK